MYSEKVSIYIITFFLSLGTALVSSQVYSVGPLLEVAKH